MNIGPVCCPLVPVFQAAQGAVNQAGKVAVVNGTFQAAQGAVNMSRSGPSRSSIFQAAQGAVNTTKQPGRLRPLVSRLRSD